MLAFRCHSGPLQKIPYRASPNPHTLWQIKCAATCCISCTNPLPLPAFTGHRNSKMAVAGTYTSGNLPPAKARPHLFNERVRLLLANESQTPNVLTWRRPATTRRKRNWLSRSLLRVFWRTQTPPHARPLQLLPCHSALLVTAAGVEMPSKPLKQASVP